MSTIDTSPADRAKNPTGMRGLAFAELCGSEPELRALLGALGFSRTRRHASRALDVYTQGSAVFLVNDEPGTHAAEFRAAHGPCVSALGFLVDDPGAAFAAATARGARPYTGWPARSLDAPAVHGVGDSLIYFVKAGREGAVFRECPALPDPTLVPDRGLLCFDHLTNNVAKGELATWAKFYEEIFGFTHVRSFDIRGNKTGLYSFALRSPDGSFCIPINEDKGGTGQIAEYLREYRGAGIQHIALLSRDLLSTLDRIGGAVPTLDIDASYYEHAFARVPGVRESPERIRAHNVLVDGDPEGYLLQIFTQNCIGPIFFELIQRENHLSFGEGNFGALFRSIERDQERRGVI